MLGIFNFNKEVGVAGKESRGEKGVCVHWRG